MALAPSRTQQQRQPNPPANLSLRNGELYLDEANRDLWVGCPPSVDPTGLLRIPTDKTTGPPLLPFLPLAGGVMLGAITLAANAAAPLQPVSLQQMQAATANYLPLAGGVMSGPLTLAANAASALQPVPLNQLTAYVSNTVAGYLPLAGGVLTGALTLAANATLPMQPVPLNQLTGAMAGYLPLTGGTLSGNLGIVSVPPVNAIPGQLFVAQHLCLNGGGNNIVWNAFVPMPGATWQTRAIGPAAAISLGTNATLSFFLAPSASAGAVPAFITGMWLDAVGDLTVTRDVIAAAVLAQTPVSNPNGGLVGSWSLANNSVVGIWNGANTLWFGNADGNGVPTASRASLDPAGNLALNGQVACTNVVASGGVFQIAAGYNMQRNPVDGAWRWVEGGTVNLTLDIAGNLTARGSVVAGGNFYAPGNVTGLNVVATSVVFGAGGVFCNSPGSTSFGFWQAPGFSNFQFSPSWAWSWNTGTGQLTWNVPAGGLWNMRASDNLCWNALGQVGGMGPYVDLSDRRAKLDVAPSVHGLDVILQLEPVSFKRKQAKNARLPARTELGFVAQDVLPILPEAVMTMGVELPDGGGTFDDEEPSLGMLSSVLVAVLVNGMKEMHALIDGQAKRITALEAGA
jgi:hypothetical protein